MSGDVGTRIRNVTAVLGPTNTGKTHLAIERMLGHGSGMIGLPLRLLAREVYDKIGKRIGFDKVSLITGEEKIKPEGARYWVSTVEAMPRDLDVDFLAIDEVQLAADPERGHIFTDRLLNLRGRSETLLLGAQTMRDVIADLIPGANFISRPRLSKLTYAGSKKITRLPPRTAIVAFSANEVYSLAELIRRQSGGAAVILGALSPRTRNAQVELYQSGEVDYLVATDAIGMGLNLDVNHVAFAAVRKFDGHNHRDLLPAELAQIAGRAGRHMNDGTFGVTGTVEPLDPELIERLESHNFDPVRVLQWRNPDLDFKTVDSLKGSLREGSNTARLLRARDATDVEVLELITRDDEIKKMASAPESIERLWEICQVPDYRKISITAHAELVSTLYKYLNGPTGKIDEDWFETQVAFADKTDGDIDTLSNRIAHIRTWTFVANHAQWLSDPEHWQQRTRTIEDKLSDALHDLLTQRFVDRRTSALMKGMRDKDELSAEIGDDGSVNVEGHFVGKLSGFRFTPDTEADGLNGKAARTAATQALAGELAMRVRRVVSAKGDAFKLSRAGKIMWRDMEIATIEPSDDQLNPIVTVIADEEHISAPDREKIRERLDAWLKDLISERLKPLKDLAKCSDVSGLARGIAFQLVENFGILTRESVAKEITALDQPARAQLRKYGVRFGAFNIYIPILLKPAPAELSATLWASKHASTHGLQFDDLPEPPRPGLTSVVADPKIPQAFYRAFGYQICGPRAVRLDILERLADQIRPLLAWRKKDGSTDEPPIGSTGEGGFTTTPEMMSILGCSPDELSHVLNALGFVSQRRPKKADNDDTKPAQSTPTGTKEDSAQNKTNTGGETATPTPQADAPTTEASPPAPEPTAAAKTAETPETSKTTDSDDKKASDQTTPDDTTTYEEIWRPKRYKSHDNRHRHAKGRDQSKRHQTNRTSNTDSSSPKADANGTPKNDKRADRSNTSTTEASRTAQAKRPRRQAGPKRGRNQDQRSGNRQPKSFQSHAPRKKAGLDPDSPFAALQALREELTKPKAKPGTAKDKS